MPLLIQHGRFADPRADRHYAAFLRAVVCATQKREREHSMLTIRARTIGMLIVSVLMVADTSLSLLWVVLTTRADTTRERENAALQHNPYTVTFHNIHYANG